MAGGWGGRNLSPPTGESSLSASVAPPTRISEWRVVKGGLVVGAGMMAGQALGFVRHAAIAYSLGTVHRADALAVAFVPVDFLWAVLSTAVVFGFGPMLAAHKHLPAGPSFTDLARGVARITVLATIALILVADPLAHLLAPGLADSTREAAAGLLRITLLAVPALAGSALFTALLYSERRFTLPALHQSVVNLATILTALIDPRHGAASFASGYVLGAWLQLVALYLVSRPLLRAQTAGQKPVKLGPLFEQPALVLAYAILLGLNAVVTRALASTFGEGATVGFDYSLRLLGVPLALLVTPLASSLLSEIARFRRSEGHPAPLKAIRKAALLTGCAAAAVVVVVELAAPRLVSLLFQRGRFDAESTLTVSAILTGFFPALVAWSVMDILARSLFSLGKGRAPLAAAGLGLVINACVSAAAPIPSIHWIGAGAIAGFAAGALVLAKHLHGLGRSAS